MTGINFCPSCERDSDSDMTEPDPQVAVTCCECGTLKGMLLHEKSKNPDWPGCGQIRDPYDPPGKAPRESGPTPGTPRFRTYDSFYPEPPGSSGSPFQPDGETGAGLKFDADKLDWTLLPVRPTEGIIRVLHAGARKYDRDNWQLVDDGERRYLAALIRHAMAIVQGEIFDPETGELHTSHIGCNALFLSHFQVERLNNDE